MQIDIEGVKSYLLKLQDAICESLQKEDGKAFREDSWEREEGGGGRSRVLEEGNLFEKAGVNFSHVFGSRLPASATAQRPELASQLTALLKSQVEAGRSTPGEPQSNDVSVRWNRMKK